MVIGVVCVVRSWKVDGCGMRNMCAGASLCSGICAEAGGCVYVVEVMMMCNANSDQW